MYEVFNFNGVDVRTSKIGGKIWFVAKEVASILGYKNARQALASHVDDIDRGVQILDTLGGPQEVAVVNESGLYALILACKLPQAKAFKHWVTSEVLPAIQREGGYIRKDLDEDAFIALFTGQKKLREQQATMIEDIDYLKKEQPIHPGFAQVLLKKRKARVVECLGGFNSPAYADKGFAKSVFKQAEADFKEYFCVSRYDLLPKKYAQDALKYWTSWEPSMNVKLQIERLNTIYL